MELVDDVLLNVFEHVSQMTGWSRTTLRAVRLTCRRFERLAGPILLRYLTLVPSNLSTVLHRLACRATSWRVRGICFPDLDRSPNVDPALDDMPRNPGICQYFAAEVLRALPRPRIQELNLAMFAGASVDPTLAAALKKTTASLKRLTVSVSSSPHSDSIMRQILASLHPNVRLDVLYLAGLRPTNIERSQYPLVRFRSFVADFRGLRVPNGHLRPVWQKLLEQKPRVVDFGSLQPLANMHFGRPGLLADVEAISVTGYHGRPETVQDLLVSPSDGGSDRPPKLRLITCDATTAQHDLQGVVEGQRVEPCFRNVTTLVIVNVDFEPWRTHERIIRFGSVAGMPSLTGIIVVGTCTVEVIDATAAVSIKQVRYPPRDDVFLGRVDLLWLLDTGDVRFLPE